MSTWSSRTHIALEAPSLAAILQLTRDDNLDVGVHFTEGRKQEYRGEKPSKHERDQLQL